MESSLYQFVLSELDNTPLTYQEIADGSGVNRRTVEKIARQEVSDPGINQIELLAAFFRRPRSTVRAA